MILIWLPVSTLFQEPQFDQYPASDCPEFEEVKELKTDSLSQRMKEAASYQWKEADLTFACRYFIVQGGCGTGCQMNIIFDKQSGEEVASFITSYGSEFRADSKLIILPADPSYDRKTEYLVFEENELHSVK